MRFLHSVRENSRIGFHRQIRNLVLQTYSLVLTSHLLQEQQSYGFFTLVKVLLCANWLQGNICWAIH